MSVLILPALRGEMGDWIYYTVLMKLKDVGARIKFATEIHPSETMKDLLQRTLDKSGHAESIKRFLLEQEQRFFNALVVAVYGGQPEWYSLTVDKSNIELPEQQFSEEIGKVWDEDIEAMIGILVLQGGEKLFALDGQHRVAGIQKALKESETLGDETVTVIFVSHRNDYEGLMRSRRLFTRLNRYAKPVSEYEKIALDEDDIVSIVTRRLLDDHRLFRNRVTLNKQKAISRKDTTNLTSVITLYQIMDIYLQEGTVFSWKKVKETRPDDEKLKSYWHKTNDLWDVVMRYFPPFATVFDLADDAEIIEYRHEAGGHFLFRPIGLLIFFRVLRLFLNNGYTTGQAIHRLANVPMEISEPPWASVMWNPELQRMLTDSVNQKVATNILLYLSGGELNWRRINEGDLQEQYMSLTRQNFVIEEWEAIRKLAVET